jgi:hypothetical protein
MNATTTIALLAVFGLGTAVGVQAPQNKENAAGAPPKLADVLKGYVGQDCWYQYGTSGFVFLRFTPQSSMPELIRTKLELVGQDFLKFANEVVVPFSSLGQFTGKRP